MFGARFAPLTLYSFRIESIWKPETPLSTLSTNTAQSELMDAISRLRDNITSVFYGNPAAVERVIRCLLARGHVLIEDVPGVGKTVLATAVAKSMAT